jgi:hypothetical protein
MKRKSKARAAIVAHLPGIADDHIPGQIMLKDKTGCRGPVGPLPGSNGTEKRQRGGRHEQRQQPGNPGIRGKKKTRLERLHPSCPPQVKRTK